MYKYLIVVMSALLVFGCASMYPEISDTENSSFLQFERDAKSPVLGSTTIFVNVRDEFKCKRGQGFLGEKKLATLDKGNPLVESKNEHGLRIKSENNFRVLVRSVAGPYNSCDVIVGFKDEPKKEYKLSSYSNQEFGSSTCSAKIYEKILGGDGRSFYKEITFTEYSECK